MSFTYKHPHPAVTVDGVVFGFDEADLKLLLVRRKSEPCKGAWALPGGFVALHEGLEEAARRELREETGIGELYLEQLYTFGDPKRDPRERVISVAYYALVKLAEHSVRADSDAAEVAWFPVAELPELAFDHERIVEIGLKRLKAKVRYEPIGFELLPEKFTLGELQRLYETVLEQDLDKRNFRKKILGMELLEALDEYQQDVAHRAAQYYRFNHQRYEQLRKRGFNFEL
ncbi:Bifunctional NMN adenylyltransferase/Nudix hydrolase [Lacunisphaera limnophila]|uniref:Bifunctional NMN adenylyltransferase/Nudix hydrolase n=1 Tax=Lacunisphaera limnophila TaxID=1838286 RepID=A0A1D8AZ20_9BACT|nr:NUDIX domain-containing protein [Lacunisphaera limnophila]AOS46111.1 Bifunctional NMN adenylyltransferase/Nudix hydrolase [Lacunisphaera limnophila]